MNSWLGEASAHFDLQSLVENLVEEGGAGGSGSGGVRTAYLLTPPVVLVWFPEVEHPHICLPPGIWLVSVRRGAYTARVGGARLDGGGR